MSAIRRQVTKLVDHRCGSKKCSHGVSPRFCTQCALLGIGGAGLCEHGNNKYYCISCGTGIMCKHGRRRKKCEVCAAQIHKDVQINEDNTRDEQRSALLPMLEQAATLVSQDMWSYSSTLNDVWDLGMNLSFPSRAETNIEERDPVLVCDSSPSFDDILIDMLLRSSPGPASYNNGCVESRHKSLRSWVFSGPPHLHTSCLREVDTK